MKKLVFIIVFTLLFTSIHAQKLRFSFLANPQLTWLSGNSNSYTTEGIYMGINTGLEADIFFTENYAFSTAIQLNNVRGVVSYTDSITYTIDNDDLVLPANSEMQHRLQYLGIPLGLKFKTIEIGYSTYWINTGVTPMILLKSTVSDETETFDKTGFRDETRFFNMNIFVEGGLEYSLGGNTAIVAGLGYYSGFMDITKRNSESLQTQSFAFILGLLF